MSSDSINQKVQDLILKQAEAEFKFSQYERIPDSFFRAILVKLRLVKPRFKVVERDPARLIRVVRYQRLELPK